MARSGSKKEAKSVGRYVDPHVRGRVTAKPVHQEDGSSPAWFGWLLIDLLAFGVLVITLNYLAVLPGSTSPWYLALGLVSLFAAFYLATRYH